LIRIGAFASIGLVLATLTVAGIDGRARPLEILYTNDLHLRFARLESLEALIEEERAAGVPVLLLDGGDALQDFRTPLAAVWGADEMVAWMNRVGYDAMALGNHELYWGSDRLVELVAAARFPILCANLATPAGLPSPFVASTVHVVDGIRIFLVGVVTNFHLPYPDFPWLRHVRPATAIRREIERLTEPVDVIVAVGHVPVAVAAETARDVPGIDVFVTGHSHEETAEPVRVGKTLIVQAGAFGRALGRLVVDVGDDGAKLLSNDLLRTEEAPIRVGRGLLQLALVVLTFATTVLLVLL